MKNQQPNISRLNYNSDYDLFKQISALHISEIHHGVLPLLGLNMLARIYRQLARDNCAGVWVSLDGDRVSGFITGTINTKSSFIRILISPAIWLYALASGFYLSPKILKKIPSVLFYPFLKNDPNPDSSESSSAELLSIAIAKRNRGQGLGKLLVSEMDRWLSAQNIKKYLVTTNQDETGSNSFYNAIGFTRYKTMKHHDLGLQIYKKHLTVKESSEP